MSTPSEQCLENCGGVVLCGGASRRMGRPKYSLPMGEEVLLQRVVRILSTVVQPIVVVAAADQELPVLPADVLITRDARPHLGPLAGLALGLKALQEEVSTVYATACDAPLLQTDFVRFVLAQQAGYDLAIPRTGGYHHPLAAAYSTHLATAMQALVDAERYRPVFLLEQTRSRELSEDELRQVDPELLSLRNMNTPEDYAATLALL